jgi:hypothetical protein
MQNVQDIENKIAETVSDVYSKFTWDTYVREFYFYYPGISGSSTSLLSKDSVMIPTGRVPFREVLKISNKVEELNDFYLQSQLSEDTRFNRITLKITSDLKIESKYFWDQEYYLKDKLQGVRVFPQWLNDRMLILMFEKFYKNKKWDSAIFEFQVFQGTVIFKAVVSEGQSNNIKIEKPLPKFESESILLHHKSMNEGELKDYCKQWNTLIIKSPNNDIDLDRDVEYL